MRKLASLTFAGALVLGPAAVPALAGTETGSATCNSANPVAVRGEQQAYADLVLKVRGVTFCDSAQAFVGYGYSPYASGSWSADSDWLLKSGTYGFCATS